MRARGGEGRGIPIGRMMITWKCRELRVGEEWRGRCKDGREGDGDNGRGNEEERGRGWVRGGGVWWRSDPKAAAAA